MPGGRHASCWHAFCPFARKQGGWRHRCWRRVTVQRCPAHETEGDVMPSDSGELQDTAYLEGRYANYFQVGHTAFEFVFDFGQFDVTAQTGRLHTRIVTAPAYACVFLELLQESIAQY